MVQYLFEIVAFQLVFLIVYDLFLRQETFFQANRAYLLATFVLSLVLPKISVEALQTSVSQEAVYYPVFLWELSPAPMATARTSGTFLDALGAYEWVFIAGMPIMALWFGIKLWRIQLLRERGRVRYYPNYVKVVVYNSKVAFSFFKQVFLGDGIPKEKAVQIIAHELVHIRQWHSLDLLFFELFRIVFWFNPLVYLYQRRLAALHEFIADAHTAKHNRKEQYQLLLSETFKTEKLSFVNPFLKHSLIKKRIVMLTKQQSKAVHQVKYVVLLPLVLGMLVYSSCEQENTTNYTSKTSEVTVSDAQLIAEIEKELSQIENLKELLRVSEGLAMAMKNNTIPTKREFFTSVLVMRTSMERISDGNEVKMEEFLRQVPYPTTDGYLQIVNRLKAYQILDKDLMAHTSDFKYKIRQVEKTDKNLGAGELIPVGNVRHLTASETSKVVAAMKVISAKNKMVFISDSNYGFLITDVVAKNSGEQYSKNKWYYEKNSDFVPFAVADEVPIFPGCEGALDTKFCFQEKVNEHIRKHFRYPVQAQEQGIEGRVSVLFTIDKSGAVVNIKKRGPHPLLEEEVERIITHLPQMIPGKHEGTVVAVPFSIPVNFALK